MRLKKVGLLVDLREQLHVKETGFEVESPMYEAKICQICGK